MMLITKRTWERWLAVLLSVAMLLTLLPATALAAEPDGAEKQITVQEVQALIDALPDAESITADNRADVEAQLNAIDEAKLALDDDELDELDIARYLAAVEALLALDDMGGADIPMPIAFPEDLPGGTGSAVDPYQISTADELKKLSEYVNSGKDCTDLYFELTDEINLEGEWTPIGNNSNQFKGTFDGNSHTVNVLIFDGRSNSGLFGYIGKPGSSA